MNAAVHLEAPTALEPEGDTVRWWLISRPTARPSSAFECGRTPRADENADDDWRAESDGVGSLLVFCPECWQREF